MPEALKEHWSSLHSQTFMRVSLGVTRPNFFSRGPLLVPFIIKVNNAMPPTIPNNFELYAKYSTRISSLAKSHVIWSVSA